MSYFGEFRTNWRAVVSASIGHAGGLAINVYLASIFASPLLAEFKWPRSEYALFSAAGIIGLVCFPVVGRLVDMFGVRRVALLGVIVYPLSNVALSLMTGNFFEYFAISMLQIMLAAGTTSIVYTRVVAAAFERARGLGIACVTCGPPIVGAIVAPLLSGFVTEHGWRAGFQALAALSAILGTIAMILLPTSKRIVDAPITGRKRSVRQDAAILAKSPAFWIIVVAMFLSNVHLPLGQAQLQLLLLDNGASVATAAYLLSIYALGVLGGRIVTGLALDWFPARIVTAVGMGLPAVGLTLFASKFHDTPVLALAVVLMGVSQGAEGDLIAYVISRFFPIEVYGSVIGIAAATSGVAATSGALLLSFMLKRHDSYTPFVSLAAASVFVGALLFLMLGRTRPIQTLTVEPPASALAQQA